MKSSKVLTISLLAGLILVSSHSLSAKYAYNKKITQNVLSILEIHDNESYLSAKSKASKYLNPSLNSVTFSSHAYKGANLPEPVIDINSFRCDLRDPQRVTVKVDVTLNYETAASRSATLLITIKGGLVTYIERI